MIHLSLLKRNRGLLPVLSLHFLSSLGYCLYKPPCTWLSTVSIMTTLTLVGSGGDCVSWNPASAALSIKIWAASGFCTWLYVLWNTTMSSICVLTPMDVDLCRYLKNDSKKIKTEIPTLISLDCLKQKLSWIFFFCLNLVIINSYFFCVYFLGDKCFAFCCKDMRIAQNSDAITTNAPTPMGLFVARRSVL